ncbi:MAG: transglutaminase domain-containing protein [Candidatus Aenigmatarchaeota archaeon]
MKLLVIITIFLLSITISFSTTPKSITSLIAELTISGEIEIIGNIKEISTKVYIPQEGIKNISVYPNSWKFTKDDLNNTMIEISWKNPSNTEKYEIKIVIENKAKFFENLTKEEWFIDLAKKETNLTIANDEIRKLAYGNETILEKAIRLTKWIDENIEYDWDALEKSILTQRSAIEVLKERKGVSGEMSNFLVAAMRTQNIPARVVFSYTLEEIEDTIEQKVAHGWAEVYIDGKWVPFDITFLESGYLDASHIKFANLLENNAYERTSYLGIGDVIVKRNPLKIKVINYSVANFSLVLDVKEETKGNEAILAKAKTFGPCRLEKLELISCIDSNKKPLLKILDNVRKFWFCNEKEINFLILIPRIKENEIIKCPITLINEYGSIIEKHIIIDGNFPKLEEEIIEGPSQASILEKIKLKTKSSGIWFSPNFTLSKYGNEIELQLNKPGKYKLYFYSNGKFGEKEIEILDVKEFEFVNIELPKKVEFKKAFSINVTIKNLLNKTNNAKMKIEFQNKEKIFYITFNPLEEKLLALNLTAEKDEISKIVLSVEGKTLNTYITFVEVSKQINIIDILIKILEKLFSIFIILLGVTI